MSLKDKILGADDLVKKSVEVPEWDVTIDVCSMTARQRSEVLEGKIGADGGLNLVNLYPKLLSVSLRDPETGELIFTEEEAEALLDKNSGILENLAKITVDLAGLGEKSLKEAEKN